MRSLVLATLIAAVFLCVSCKTPSADMKMHLPMAADFHAHIARNILADTNTLVRVQVVGAVNSPGEVELPNGSTVLDAIKQVGGFTDFASTKQLVLIRGGSRMGLELRREMMGAGFLNHYRVWYVLTTEDTAVRESERGQRKNGDVILEAHDQVFVRMIL